MTKILVINAGQAFAHSRGQLNLALAEVAESVLTAEGHEVEVTETFAEYDAKKELEKFLWADVIIWQFPAWWFGCPWTMKKYIDEVFTEGVGKLWASDGRTRSDPSKKYGSGGLCPNKKYMLSGTWNAPEEAFTDPAQMYHGAGVDSAYEWLHHANQFLAFEKLPTYAAFDVMKDPQAEKYFQEYGEHLKKYIK